MMATLKSNKVLLPRPCPTTFPEFDAKRGVLVDEDGEESVEKPLNGLVVDGKTVTVGVIWTDGVGATGIAAANTLLGGGLGAVRSAVGMLVTADRSGAEMG